MKAGKEITMTYTDKEIEDSISELLIKMNEKYNWGLDSEEIENTPGRIVRAFGEFNDRRNYDKFKTFEVNAQEQLVIVKGMEFYSLCSHHFLPFFGKISIAYIPEDKVVGVSKISRVVSSVSLKPSLQEKIGIEIADKLEEILHPAGILVVIEAQHMCMMMRGVRDSPMMVTSVARGIIRNKEALKTEVMNLLK